MTVMTMMRILEERATSSARWSSGRTSTSPRSAAVVGAMVRDFVDRVFDGASDALLLHLAKDSRLTEKQRQLMKQLVEDVED